MRMTQRGGWRIESDGSRFRVCVNVAAVSDSRDKSVRALPELCSPWFSLGDVVAESRRFIDRVRGWFRGKKAP